MANTIKTRSEPKEIMGLNRITKKRLLELCKKDKLYQTPSLNDVLYLHYQGFQCIECLDDYTELKCLWLECNAISEIQGLENQTKLKCLYLQSNLIKKIENLECCKELDTINLSQNHIRKIENVGDDILPVLNTLNISSNYISDSEGLRELENCRNLSVLDLSNNRIDDILVVKIFAKMPELKVLVLQGNPVVSKIPQYRKTLILECKNLTYLDSRPVFPKDRACAEAWKRGGYEEERKESERWNRKERRKMRDSVNATIRMRNKFRKPEDHLTLLVSSDSEDEAAKSKRKRQVQEPDTGVDMELGLWEEVAGDDNKSETTSSSDMNTSSSTSVISTTDSNDAYSSSNSKCSAGQDVLNNTNANEEKVLGTSEKGDNMISVLAENQNMGEILKFINDKNQTGGLDKKCMVEDQNEGRKTNKKDDVTNGVDNHAEEREIVETAQDVRLDICQLRSSREGFGEQNGEENKEDVLPELIINLETTDLVEAEGINIVQTTRDSLDSDDDHTPADSYKPTLDAICRVTTNDLNQSNVNAPRRVYLQIETSEDSYEPYVEMEKAMQTMTKQEYTDEEKSGEINSNLDNLKIETKNSQSQLEYEEVYLAVNNQLKSDFEQMSSSMDIHFAQLQRDKEERREVLEALFSQKEATKETSSGSSDTEAEYSGNERRCEGIIQQWDRETKLKSKDNGSTGDTLEMELMTHIHKQKLSKELGICGESLESSGLIKDQTTKEDNTQNVSRETDVSTAFCEHQIISVKNVCEEPDKSDPQAFSYELSEKSGDFDTSIRENALESFPTTGEIEIKSELTEIENVDESTTSVYGPIEEHTEKLVLNIPIPSCADLNNCEPKIIVVKNVCEKPDKGDPQAFSNELSEKFGDFQILIGKTASENYFVNTGEIKSELVERDNVGESLGNFNDSYQESSKKGFFELERETKNIEFPQIIGKGCLGGVPEADIDVENAESAAKELDFELERETKKLQSQKAIGKGCLGGVFEADIEADLAEGQDCEESATKELDFELERKTNKIDSDVPEVDLNNESLDIALLTQASNQALDSFERETKELKNLLQKLENENEELYREINAESKCVAEESKQQNLDVQWEINAESKFEAEENSQEIKEKDVHVTKRSNQLNKDLSKLEKSIIIIENKEISNNNNKESERNENEKEFEENEKIAKMCEEDSKSANVMSLLENERKIANLWERESKSILQGKDLKENKSEGKIEISILEEESRIVIPQENKSKSEIQGKDLKENKSEGMEEIKNSHKEQLNSTNIEEIDEIDREKLNQRITGEIDEEKISQESSPNSKPENGIDHEIHLRNREEDIKEMCQETARDIIESLTLKQKSFSFPDLESYDDYIGESLREKGRQSSDLPLCKTIHEVIESLTDIFKDRSVEASKRPRVATTKAEKSESLNNLAEQPNLKEFNKDSHESLDKLLDAYKRQQGQEIRQMVDRVYKQKERYDDTIELIEGRLMVVNKDTGELKELPAASGHYANASDEDYDTAESADEGACCTSKPRTGRITKESAVEGNWSKHYGLDYETAGSADEGACCSKPRTGSKTKGSAMDRSWPKSYGPKSTGLFGEINFSQVENLENEESDDEEFYSLDTRANVYGDIDNEFFDKLSFQHLEFSQQDGDHMVQCSRSYEELKSYLTRSKEERHLTADESDLLEAMLERKSSRTNNEVLNNVKELRKAEDNLLKNMLQRTKEKERMKGLNLQSKQELEIERNTSYGQKSNEFLKLFEFSPETEKLLLIDCDPEIEEETEEETDDETEEELGFGQGIYTFIHNDLKEKNEELAKLYCAANEEEFKEINLNQIENKKVNIAQTSSASNQSSMMRIFGNLSEEEKTEIENNRDTESNAAMDQTVFVKDMWNSQNFSQNSQIWKDNEIPCGEVLNANKSITVSAAELLTRDAKVGKKEDTAMWKFSLPLIDKDNSQNFSENSQIWKNIQIPCGEVLNANKTRTYAAAEQLTSEAHYDKKEDIWQYSSPPRRSDNENSLNFPENSQISSGEVLNASKSKTYAAIAEQLTRAEEYNRKEDIWQYSPPRRSDKENSLNFPEDSQIWKNSQIPPRDSYLNTYPTDNDDEERVLAKIRNSRILWENPEPEIPNQSLHFPCLSKPLGDFLFPLGNHFPVNQRNSSTKIADENLQQSLNTYTFYNSGRMEETSAETKNPESESLFTPPSEDICEKITHNPVENFKIDFYSKENLRGFNETQIPNGKFNIIQNSSRKLEKRNLILNSVNHSENGNFIPDLNTQPEFIPDIRENNLSINACATKETSELETLFNIPDANYCRLKTDSELNLKDNSPEMNDEISSGNANKIPKTDLDEILSHGLNETSSRKNIIPNSDVSTKNDIFDNCEGFTQPEDIIAIRKYISPINSWAEETLKSETLCTIENANILEEMASNFSDNYRLKNDFEFTLSGNLPVIYEAPNSDIEAEISQSNSITGNKENNLQINTAENISDYSKAISQPGNMPDNNEHNPPINSLNLQNLDSLPKDIPTNFEPNSLINPTTSQKSVTDFLPNKRDYSPSCNFQVIPDMTECSGENPQLGPLPKGGSPNTEPNSLTNHTISQNTLPDFLVTIQDSSPSRNVQEIPDMTEYSDEILQTEHIPVNNAHNPPINPEAYISSYIKAMSQSLCKPKFESEGIWLNTEPKSYTNLSELQIPDSESLCNTQNNTQSSNDNAIQNSVIATDISGDGKVIPTSEFIPANNEENPPINPEAEISNNSKTIFKPEYIAVNNVYNPPINPEISQKLNPGQNYILPNTEPSYLQNPTASQNHDSELLFTKQDNIQTRSYNLIQNSGIEADMSECGKIILQTEFLPDTNENNSPKNLETYNIREIIPQSEIIPDNKQNNHPTNPAADISICSSVFMPRKIDHNLEINPGPSQKLNTELEDILPNSQPNSHTNSAATRNPDSDLQDKIPTRIAKVILNSVVEAEISGYVKETLQTEVIPEDGKHNSPINPETDISDCSKLNLQSELIPENEEYNPPLNVDTSQKPISVPHNTDPNIHTNPFVSQNRETYLSIPLKQQNEDPSQKIEIIYKSAIESDITDYGNKISQPEFIHVNNAHNPPVNPEANILTSDKAANPQSEFIPNNNKHNPPINPDTLPKQISKVENISSSDEYNLGNSQIPTINPKEESFGNISEEFENNCVIELIPNELSLEKHLNVKSITICDNIKTILEDNPVYNVQNPSINTNTSQTPISKIDNLCNYDYNPMADVSQSVLITSEAESLDKMWGICGNNSNTDVNAEPSLDKQLSDDIATNNEDNPSYNVQNLPTNPDTLGKPVSKIGNSEYNSIRYVSTSENSDLQPLSTMQDVEILDKMSGKCDNNAEPSLGKQLSDDKATNKEDDKDYNAQNPLLNPDTFQIPISKIDNSEYNPITNVTTSRNPDSQHSLTMQNAEILNKLLEKYDKNSNIDVNTDLSLDKQLSATATTVCDNTKTILPEDNPCITDQNIPKNPGNSQNPDTEPLPSTPDVDVLECNLEILDCNEDVIDIITVNAEFHYNF